MRKNLILLLLTIIGFTANAQYLTASDSLFNEHVPKTGRIWGYSFGDYFYKAHSDSLARGGLNQYSNVKTNDNGFALRRVYLGYDFNISKKFSTEVLLTAEDWNQQQNFTFFLKYANIRWRNIWKGTDLVVGQSVTPGFSKSSEKFWSYRSIERTIIDNRRTQSFDLGISLQGKLNRKGNIGYSAMVGNGRGAMAENNRFKKYYGNVYGYFLDKKLLVDVYADYEKVDWNHHFHHSRTMVKIFVGYTTPAFTVGGEVFLNHGQKDVIATKNVLNDTLSGNSLGVSLFIRGKIIENKLSFFARADVMNPYLNADKTGASNYTGLSVNFNPNVKELFLTAGVDFTPIKNVHFMPNVWFNGYQSQDKTKTGRTKNDYDLVYRLTFYYEFGK